MFSYNYRARDNAGTLVRGVIEGPSQDEVAEKLRRMGYVPVVINKAFAGLRQSNLEWNFRRIKTEDVVMFNLQLANMLNGGLNILTSLDTLRKQCENKNLREIIDSVSQSIEAGESFSQALAKHPRVFPNLLVSMVKAAEASGGLDAVLKEYAEYAEAQENVKRKLKEALYYPLILIIGATAVIVFIATFLMPKFVEVFNRAEISLPPPTIILYGLGTGIREYWYMILLGGMAAILGLRAYIKTDKGRFVYDTISLKLPVLGPIVRKICISRFARTMSTLIKGGVPILNSLDIVGEVVNNHVLRRVIRKMQQSVEKGERIAENPEINEEFPPDALQMISIGEESGNLEEMLNKISEFYNRFTEYSIKKLVASLEPILLVIMGGVVAFTMASLLLPMFKMITTLRR